MINVAIFTGRLTRSPELKYLQSGIPVCRFTLAVNRSFKTKDGEQQADFINCVAWRTQAENVANYLSKGSLVGIEGRIQTSSFDGKDGNKVFMTEVVANSVQFLEPKSANAGNAPSNQSNGYQQQGNTNAPSQPYGSPVQHNTENSDPFSGGEPFTVDDSDLPF